MKKKKSFDEYSKDWKMPSEKQIKKRMCEDNLKKLIPKRCKVCNSKYLYYDPMAGPIVDGVGTCNHPPNAHPAGAWICLDCAEKQSKEQREYEQRKRRQELPKIIDEKKGEIVKLKNELKELEKEIGGD